MDADGLSNWFRGKVFENAAQIEETMLAVISV